jgi:hypothetical protein
VAKLLQDEAAAANGSGYSFLSSCFETWPLLRIRCSLIHLFAKQIL